MGVDVAAIAVFVLKTSIFLTVFALGLRATVRDATSLFRKPKQLSASLLAMIVIMPLVAILLITLFDLHPAIKVALVVLAVSPIPPTLPKKVLKAGGDRTYTIGLLMAASLFAIVLVPVAVAVLGLLFAVPVSIPWTTVVQIMLTTVLLPLAAGMIIYRLAPTFANRVATPLSYIAMVLLVLGVLPVLITILPAVLTLIGGGTLIVIVVFILLGLLAGHLFGGKKAANQIVLSSMTATRHPGIAIVVASANAAEHKTIIIGVIVLYVLANAIISLPYFKWCARNITKAKKQAK